MEREKERREEEEQTGQTVKRKKVDTHRRKKD